MTHPRIAPQRRPLVTALLLGLGLSPFASFAGAIQAAGPYSANLTAGTCMPRQAILSMNNGTVSGDCAIAGAVGSQDSFGFDSRVFSGNSARWDGAVSGVAEATTLPAGCRIVSGSGSLTWTGETLTISQSSAVLTIDCSSFHVSAKAAVIFDQVQGSESIVIVRISDQTPSQIFGAIAANGRVFLIHPNGILFGARSQVQVSGLVASSLDISDADLIANTLKFGNSGDPGAVSNQGSITTSAGGQVYLIAARVQNTGIIASPQGNVLLAAGRNVQLIDGGGLNSPTLVSAPADRALNSGVVVAHGGKIGIYGALVEQNGVVDADSAVVGEHGEIVFKSSQTTTLASDSQTTAIGAGAGGNIYLQGANVNLIDNARVDASGRSGGGTVFVGGGFHGTNAAIENAATTYIGANSQIRADAIQSGDGGQVAVWSNTQTAIYGNISARGGANGGSGGYVETSGHSHLDFQGRGDLKAPQGTTGTLLLDPFTITIDDTGSAAISPTGSNPVSYTSGADSDVTAATINAQLASANVIVQTGAGGGGSVTVASNNLNWNTSNTLTLAASANVNINGSILGQSGNLELIATAGNITQTAPVNVAALSAKAGGDVILTNAANIVGTLAGTSGGTGGFQFSSGDNVLVGSVSGNSATVTGIAASGTGGVGLNAGGSVATSSASISGPSLSITSTSGVGSVFNPLSTAVGSLSITNGGPVGGGDIVVSNSGAVTLSDFTQTASGSLGRIYLIDDNAMTVGAGGIVQNNGNPGAEIGLVASSGIAINGPVRNGAYTVGLKTGSGDITLGASAYIQAGAFSASAPNGAVTLSSSNNAIGVIAGKSSGNFVVNDNVGTTVVGTVTLANSSLIGLQSGITSNSGDVALQNTGSIYLANPLSISTITGNVGLSSSGGYVHQSSSGTISAPGLSAYAFGDVSLNANNTVGTLAGQSGAGLIGGNFNFANSGALTVGDVATVGGLVSSRSGINALNNYSVGLTAAQDITVTAGIDSGTNTTTLASNSGAINETGSGAIHAGTLTGSSNGSTSLGGANTIGTLGSFSSAAFSLNDSIAITLGHPFTLNLSPAPTTGQTYTLVTAPSVSGTFIPATVTGFSAGQSANFSYPAGHALLTIAPMNMILVAQPPLLYGNNVTLKATFAGNAPTGTVAFQQIAPTSTTLCASSALVDNGDGTFSATCTMTAPPAGSYTAKANYAGDASNGSDSAQATFAVSPDNTTTNVTVAPPGPITLGSSVNVSASVSVVAPGGGTPMGTIAVNDGGAGAGDSCTITLPGGTSCALTPSSIGAKTITASYSGNTNFNSSSGSASLQVTPPAYQVTASVTGSGGTVSPGSQYISDGNAAYVTLTPNPGYAASGFGGSCLPGTLSGNIYTTGAVTADCNVTASFALASLTLSVTDHHSYARYGGDVTYEITLANPTGTDVSGVSISATAPSGLDLANGSWQCFGGHCTASGTGPFTDTGVTVPANGQVVWLVTLPVLENAPGATIDYTVSVTGVGAIAPQTDSDILILFHDGFNVPHADGAQ